MFRLVRPLAALSLFVLLTGCGSDDPDGVALSDDAADPTEEPDEGEPEDSEDGAPEDEEPESGEEGEPGDETAADEDPPQDGFHDGQWATVFVLRDVDGYLWVESEDRWLAQATEAVATAAMHELFTGTPSDPNLFSPTAGSGVEVLGVSLDDGLLTVDVSDAIYNASVGAAGEAMFLQALAHTGTQFDTVRAVELLVEGEAITELWGHVELSEPLTADPYAQAPIDVRRPRHGEVWPPGEISVIGTSLTYESTVELELLAPGGELAEKTFTTARQPSVDQRGPFEHTFEVEAHQPGDWTIRVIEPDPSDGEGRPPYVADIVITIE